MIHPGMYQRVLLGLALMAPAPATLVSQSPDNAVAPGPSSIQTQVTMMKLSSRLRVQASSGRHEGRLVFRTADSLGILEAGGENRIALPAVDSLWVRGHHTGTGFLIGALVGAGAYVVTTNAIDDDNEVPQLDNLFGALLWAGSVALGTIVGGITPKWSRIYP